MKTRLRLTSAAHQRRAVALEQMRRRAARGVVAGLGFTLQQDDARLAGQLVGGAGAGDAAADDDDVRCFAHARVLSVGWGMGELRRFAACLPTPGRAINPAGGDKERSRAEPRAEQEREPGPPILVVMGVSGSGKTTIGERLAARLGWPYQEGDALHPPANVAKMHSGTPLTDADRWPWLALVAAKIDAWRAERSPGIVTCSALKRRYRDVLIGDRPEARLVYLKGSHRTIGKRIAARHHHFMPAKLLESQFDALEEPGPDERPITVSVDGTPDEIAAAVERQLGLGAAGRQSHA